MAKKITDLIDDVLTELGEPTDGTGFWTRSDVLGAINLRQQDITQRTENLLIETPTLEPATNDTQITIDSDGNLLRIYKAYRLQTTESPLHVFTIDQITEYDYQWKTRTGSLVVALVTEIADAGKARLYPIPDNADNDIIVWYIKSSKENPSDFATSGTEIVEVGDDSNQLSSWSLSGVELSNTDDFKLYWELTDSGGTRTVTLYKDSAKSSAVASGSKSGDGSITLSEQNSSGLSGSVTVTYTVDDTDSSNILKLGYIEIPTIDIPCLKNGVKAELLKMEKDSKDIQKSQYYEGLYLQGLEGVITRVRKLRSGSFGTMKRRSRQIYISDIPYIDNSVVS
jgi:hypothetical protein